MWIKLGDVAVRLPKHPRSREARLLAGRRKAGMVKSTEVDLKRGL